MNESQNIVFFGGAGVSTESGIPDFRSADGIYHQDTGIDYHAEEIISNWFLERYPSLFFRYYFQHLVYPNALPNAAHFFLADLEKSGKKITIITQNIDGLHQKAGSQRVLELHGTVHKNHCMICNSTYMSNELHLDKEGIPRCWKDNGIVRPDVVLYGESLDEVVMNESIKAISKADTLIVAGTSLSVYPANSFIRYFKGNTMIVINKTSLPIMNDSDEFYMGSVGELFSRLSIQ